LAQSTLLAVMLSDESKAAYAEAEIKEHLKNFTAIYESLGHNFMSAKWLSFLEERNYAFPELNYRVFKKRDIPLKPGLL
jgi:1,4-alpha-glucan branching enzyme